MGLFRKKKRLDDGFIDMVRAHDNGEEWAQKIFDDGYDSGNPDFIRRFQEARLQIYKKAAEQGDPNACCMMGKSYMFLGDEAQSFKWFKPLIDREDGYALSIISFGYNEFGGFPPDHDQEMYWLKRSAESGYAPSQVDLGREYKIEHDYEKALYWHQKAADQNFPEGFVRTAEMLLDKIDKIKNDNYLNNKTKILNESQITEIRSLMEKAETYLYHTLSLDITEKLAADAFDFLGRYYYHYIHDLNKAAYYYYASADVGQNQFMMDFFNQIVSENNLTVYPDDLKKWEDYAFGD